MLNIKFVPLLSIHFLPKKAKKIPLFWYRFNIVCHCRLRIAFRIVFRNKKLYRFGVALSLSQR